MRGISRYRWVHRSPGASIVLDTVRWMVRRRDGLDPVACCGAIRTTVLDESEAELLARTFAALADPVRLRLLSMIAATGEIGACDVVDASGRSQPTVSHHMKVLVEAGLVTREKRGPWVWYRVVPERLDALRAVLT